jgi:hypothetical protein
MWGGRLVHLPSSLGRPASPPTRVEICPPALPRPALGWRQRLLDWLAGSWPVDEAEALEAVEAAHPQVTRVDGVRLEFVAALDDIATPEAVDLAWRIRSARSLRELWHLRTEVFNVVSRHGGQGLATARLQRLNRHFPARAPRSGFGGFDAEPHHHPGQR